MDVPHKNRWKVTASSGDPRLAIDDNYATTWLSEPSKKTWLEIDLGEVATLGGLEVYWGKQAAGIYGFESSAGRQSLGASLRHSPWRGRAGRLCVPPSRGPLRALDLRQSGTGARAGDCRNQPLWSRRGGVGAGGGSYRGARAALRSRSLQGRASPSISATCDLLSGP